MPIERTEDDLRKWFPKGSTVFCILRHRSSSGMSREIGLVVFKGSGKNLTDIHPNHAVAELLGMRLNKDGDGIVVRGVGMDMGFHLVSHLSHKLYGDEKSLKHRWI